MRQALLNVDGVVSAEVSFDDKRAEVRCEAALDTDLLVQAVEEAGFQARVIDTAAGGDDPSSP